MLLEQTNTTYSQFSLTYSLVVRLTVVQQQQSLSRKPLRNILVATTLDGLVELDEKTIG